MKNPDVPLNQQVVGWLEDRKIRETLLGEGEFFLADSSDSTRHDVMLVMFVLISWAFQNDRTRETGASLQQTLLELTTSQEERAFEILLAYAITARDLGKQLPIDAGLAFRTLKDTMLPKSPKFVRDKTDINTRFDFLRTRIRKLGVKLNN